MKLHAVTLDEILTARENRALRQQELLRESGGPLISYTMNIPGPVKDSPLIRLAFFMGLSGLKEHLTLRHAEYRLLSSGPEAFLVPDCPAAEAKRICESLEDADTYTRLYDMDVLTADGSKLTRSEPRRCLLCDKPAAECARSRRHGLEAVEQACGSELIWAASDYFSHLAEEALLREVHTTPKPGLVDENNTGAHRDMDVALFERSAHMLRGYFSRCTACGCMEARRSPAERMRLLRMQGRIAERDMLCITDGVNTHKGIIYSLGLLCDGIGTMLFSGENYAAAAAACAKSDLTETFAAARIAPKSHGERLYAERGVTGVRGEAAEGFPHARSAAKRLRELSMIDPAAAPVWLLPEIMAELEDTNVLHRGGTEGAAWLTDAAERICALPLHERTAALLKLDSECIRRNISPGGAADTLALAIFMDSAADMLQLIFPEDGRI